MKQQIEIFPVGKSKSLKKLFIDVPWRIYSSKEYPNWVPPLRLSVKESLDTVKNPFYKRAKIELFIAKKDGKVVGRIAAVKNDAHNEYHDENIGFYGYFECTNDQEVADELFKAAKSWCKNEGLDALRGPMSPSTNHECGLLVRGHSQHPTIMTTYNPKYYQDLHEKSGFEGVKDLVAYWIPHEGVDELPAKVVTRSNKLRREDGFTFRDLSTKNWDRDIDTCFEIYNAAWEKNWGFVPMTREEFKYAAEDMKLIVDPRFSYIVLKDGAPAGFMFALPDINHILKRIPNGKLFPFGLPKLLIGKKLLKTVRVVALGVKPEFRKEGIFALFSHEGFIRAKKYGLIGGEASWILEDNEGMNKPWKDMGLPIYRRWRIYQSPIQA
ncbi:MAG: N-acetyltransferase [Bacteriovoracaceae bacterium]|jgi:GNAT superfamily N-acetyltransferase|nr:N-acetyltransferase [Bacteriovoracaceae bacterium]